MPVQYNLTTQRSFSSSPDFRDFVIYHHSVSRRIEPHWVTVASDRREGCLETRSGISTMENQVKVKHIAYGMKPQASRHRAASLAHLDRITSTHHHPITQRPAASCVGPSHLDTLLSPKPTCLTMLLQHLLAVALTSFFPPNFLYGYFGANGTRSTEKYV